MTDFGKIACHLFRLRTESSVLGSIYCFLSIIVFSIGKCPIDKESIKVQLDKVNYHWLIELIKKFVLCIAESKWMFCHMVFRACVYDNSTKSLRYLPPCQETCDLYFRKSKPCQQFSTQVLDWHHKEDLCLITETFFLNCSFYPKKLSGICQDIPLSKHLFLLKKIIFGFIFAFKSNFGFLHISLRLIYLFFPYKLWSILL